MGFGSTKEAGIFLKVDEFHAFLPFFGTVSAV